MESSQFVASVGREGSSAQENLPVFEVPVSCPSAGEGVDLMVQPETLQGSSPQHSLPPHATASQFAKFWCTDHPRHTWDFSEIMLMAEGLKRVKPHPFSEIF